LAGSGTVSDLAARHGVSRKFICQQTHKAWLHQVIVGLPLICRSSYRGVVEFLRDLLGLSISIGTARQVLQSATRHASTINHDQDLPRIRVGLHGELFQGATPVLAGVDAQSMYCYLLAAERHRDANTWGVHLLDATEQGLDPDYTIANAGQGVEDGRFGRVSQGREQPIDPTRYWSAGSASRSGPARRAASARRSCPGLTHEIAQVAQPGLA